MAKSLDELIEFLLEEIALEGEPEPASKPTEICIVFDRNLTVTGLAFSKLAVLVRHFYRSTSTEDGDKADQIPPDSSKIEIRPVVDRPFLSKVWAWLARHPDVLVGRDNQYKRASLDDVEKANPGYTLLSDADNAVEPPIASTTHGLQSIEIGTAPPSEQSGPRESNGPHLFVNEERMSIAICGHVPDPTRVFPTEWALLLCIAPYRQDGILQGELVRTSGQDKRSVPKRTDALHEKGYVFKRTIYLKGNKTSQLYLRRFVNEQHPGGNPHLAIPEQLTVHHVARQLFDVLKNNPLIPQDDLADALGMRRPGRAKILSLLIRRFSKPGCMKRVRTAFGPSARSADLKICIQYLKEPAAEDWQNHNPQEIDLNQPVKVLASSYEANEPRGEDQGDHQDESVDRNEQLESFETQDAPPVMSRPVLPLWNPDRILANVLFEAARDMGSAGLTNANARNTITGPFIKRTMESLLVKISNRTLQAQPEHLRHLALLRTQEFHDGVSRYFHHTFHSFLAKIENGQAKWTDAFGGEDFRKDLRKNNQDEKNAMGDVRRDEFGFAVRPAPTLQAHNGETTMALLISNAKIKNTASRSGEPFLREVAPGCFEIAFQEKDGKHSVAQTRPADTARRSRPSTVSTSFTVEDDGITPEPAKRETIQALRSTTKATEAKTRKAKYIDSRGQPILGRPRKFVKGTEQYWRDVFASVVQDKDPKYVLKNGKSGVTNHPEAQRIFRQRPIGFDDAVLKAIALGLPVPFSEQHISQRWIDDMDTFMNETQPGLYFTPPGCRLGPRRQRAKVMILRSARLNELDFSDRKKCWPWQYISSSASHSSRYNKFYPRLCTTPHSLEAPSQPLDDDDDDDLSARIQPKPSAMGPVRGIFYEVESLPQVENTLPSSTSTLPNIPKRQDFVSGETTDDTDVEVSLPRQNELTIESRPNGVLDAEDGDNRGRPNIDALKQPGLSSVIRKSQSNVTTRPLRKRKPTAKAAANLESLQTGSESFEPPSLSRPKGRRESAADAETFPVPDKDQSEASQNAVDVRLTALSPVTDEPSGHLPHEEPKNSDLLVAIEPVGSKDVRSKENQEVIENEPPPSLPNEMANETMSHSIDDVESQDRRSSHSPVRTKEGLPENSLSSSLTDEQTQSNILASSAGAVPASVEHPGQTDDPQSAVTPKGKKRSRSVSEPSSSPTHTVQTDQIPAPKRLKKGGYEIKRASVSKLCRILVLELIGLCSGMAPNVPWTLRRAMVPRWSETGVALDQLNAKNVRAAIKSLCESGKLKSITFAFRAKSGGMSKLSVVALRGVDAKSPSVLDLQRKMQDIEPADYIPPELEAESLRAPSELNRRRYSKELDLEELRNTGDEQAITPRKTQPTSKRPRKASKDKDPEQGSEDESSTQVDAMSKTMSPNTGFLTLRVPRLNELEHLTNDEFKYKLAPVDWQPGRAPRAKDGQRATTKAKARRGRGTQPERASDLAHGAQKLRWKQTPNSRMPASLDDVPDINLTREEAAVADGSNRDWTLFSAEVDCVALWEQKSQEVFDEERLDSWRFINHHSFEIPRPLSPGHDLGLSNGFLRYHGATGEESEMDSSEAVSWSPFVNALEGIDAASMPSTPPSIGSRWKKPSKRKMEAQADLNADDDSDYIAPLAKKFKRSPRPARPRRSLRTTTDLENVETSMGVHVKRTRVVQLLRHISEEDKYRMVVAIVTVRTLIGGIEKFIDWQIVSRLLPAQDEHTLRDAWRTMANRYRGDISELTEILQHRYLYALSQGQVPSVDFNDVYAADWDGLFRWALANLDKSIVKKIEELPIHRAQLFKRNDYIFNETKGVRELLNYNTAQTLSRKEESLSGVVFGRAIQKPNSKTSPLGSRVLAEQEESDGELSRAKSWVMASMLTPETSFNVAKIQSKLLSVASTPQQSEALLERAVKSLQRDKLLSKTRAVVSEGRHRASGDVDGLSDNTYDHNELRQYEASAKFFEQFEFRRMITAAMLKRAARYKLDTLDSAFKQGSSITLPKDHVLDDGEMIAILNLMSMGMLLIRPGPDVPASLWGLEWQKHGYSTRLIDKKALGFSVVLTPLLERYTEGDPLTTTRASATATIPRDEIDRPDGKGTIPLWFDITHGFQPEMWELVLGAVLGLVSIRSGIDVQELTRSMSYAVSTREVHAVLGWALRMDLVSRTSGGTGWETKAWWWMGIGCESEWKVDINADVDGGNEEEEEAAVQVVHDVSD